jgi:hypothetical protein
LKKGDNFSPFAKGEIKLSSFLKEVPSEARQRI